MADKKHKKKQKEKRKDKNKDDIELYKHYETFYESAPPGYVRVEEEKPEDCIPDLPENEQAREFLSKAPKKGLWMPLGKEVKVMKCWRCKSYGHRTGDKECPMFVSGNQTSERFRMAHEDPMHDFIVEKKKTEKEQRIEQLKALLEEPTTSENDSSSESSDASSTHRKHKKRKRNTRKSDRDSSSDSHATRKRRKKRKHKSDKAVNSDSDSSESNPDKKHQQKKQKHKSRTTRRESYGNERNYRSSDRNEHGHSHRGKDKRDRGNS
ncbi:Hypothetical predicted protein [Paramuricea clavata]|uniref:Uncharacterized protein n=1 Tax=Paramuricea clavata TaxID=317549 RepID=A0A7D9DLE4_PARCT|nr:Hypothetical predicted protein [Paramuricea clavata]